MSTNASVYVRRGEPIDRALKRLKSKIEKEGVIEEVRRKRSFETEAQVQKRKAKKLTKAWKFMKAESKSKREQ